MSNAYFSPMEISKITFCNTYCLVKLYVGVIAITNVKMLRKVLIYYSKTGFDED
jgi:hypothetical protein